ncbi:U32 family peptidase [Flavonifractor sp. An10]|uniref:peptidase U32 family protein n=1 Tax=Flavonifractor sp. An10 TaxID=1965537 RepID=UPI0013A60966|nr:U32 family peptidase [Flavonifractor sp. An10]
MIFPYISGNKNILCPISTTRKVLGEFMFILAPINHANDMKHLAQSGADEFYIGFYETSWASNNERFYDLNRMSDFAEDANRYSLPELIEPIEEAHRLGKKIYVTLNAPYYNPNQLRMLQEYIRKLKEFKVDGVIVSNLRVADICRQEGISAVASTMCGVYNTQILSTYAMSGVKRVIVPRDVRIEDVKRMKESFPEIEFEVFMMRNGCKFSDANCLGFHCYPHGALCRTLKFSKKQIGGTNLTFDLAQQLFFNDMMFKELYEHDACGMCAIYDFTEMNIHALKIVGRAAEQEHIAKSITMVKANIAIAEQSSSRKEYLENMVFPSDPKTCFMGLSCYYPEIRFGAKHKLSD